MDLAPKTGEELEAFVKHLRRIGVQQFSVAGLFLVLCEPQPDATKVEEREPTRSHVLRMTEEEQVDLFNEVVEPTPKEKVL